MAPGPLALALGPGVLNLTLEGKQMIQGLKIHVSSVELETHLRARFKHHKEKAAFYKDQVASLREGGIQQSGVTNDPVSSLSNSEKSHLNKMAFFKFLADHIVPKETYELSEHELQNLEIYDRYF